MKTENQNNAVYEKNQKRVGLKFKKMKTSVCL